MPFMGTVGYDAGSAIGSSAVRPSMTGQGGTNCVSELGV